MSSTIDRQKILLGFKYSLLAEISLAVIMIILWLIIGGSISSFPYAIFTIAVGGLLLTIGGCVGPGRYQKEYSILLYTPTSGSSFSDEFEVSGFVMDPTITRADIMINSQKVGELEFDDNQLASTSLSRKDFISTTINSIYLKSGEVVSNSNEFTVFEYTEDMTEDEIEELHQMESRQYDKSLEEAKESYTEKVSGRIGSVIIGVSLVGIANLTIGFLLDYFLGLTF